MTRKNTDKMFIVKKYIKAKDAGEAIRKDHTAKVDEVFLDQEWRSAQIDNLAPTIGFTKAA